MNEQLTEYARLTAADMNADVAAAVRAMRDEPNEVAVEIGCTVDQVVAWCEAQA